MSELAIRVDTWDEFDRDEARFRRALTVIGVPLLALSLVISMWELTGIKEGGGDELPARYAQLLLERAQQQEEARPEPEPVVEEQPEPEVEEEVAEPEPEAEPTPEPEPEPPKQVDPAAQQRAARQRVERQFSSTFDALKDLRQDPIAGLNTPRPLQQNSAPAASTASSEAPSLITSNLRSGSGGVTAQRRDIATPRTALQDRQTTEVTSTIEASGGVGPRTDDKTGFGGDKRLQGRTLEEIQIVMDRHKGRLYSLYNRALRSDPTLQGKVVLEITIAPSGAVTGCTIVSSELNDPQLESRITSAVRLINFGAKDVSEITIKYPIHFIPS